MPSPINKKILHHLAALARFELSPREEERLRKDLQGILEHFTELEALDTSNVPTITGGTRLVNAFREDEARENTNRGKGTEAFPETENGYLKVPPVF